MMNDACSRGVGSPGHTAPAINRTPQRLQRTRRKNYHCPPGAVYVGRPTVWGNPFERRPGIGHARSVILYRAWLAGDVTPYVLRCARFSEAEIDAMSRWRNRLLHRLSELAGYDLQCWCPLTSPWRHADVLIGAVREVVTGRFARKIR